MLLGARQFFMLKKGAKPMEQVTLTSNCSNAFDLAQQLASLCASEGITTAMCSIANPDNRYNLVGVVVIVGSTYSAMPCLRYRNGTWAQILSQNVYDADARVGDVYNVYVPEGPWNT